MIPEFSKLLRFLGFGLIGLLLIAAPHAAFAQRQGVFPPGQGVQPLFRNPTAGSFGTARGPQRLKSAVPPPPPLPTRPPIPAHELENLVTDLQSGDFRTRVSATRRLKEGGVETVSAMFEAAHSPQPETSRRAISVLEAIFLSDDEDANRQAEASLAELQTGGPPRLRNEAETVLASHSLVRWVRALRDIQELGGEVTVMEGQYEIDDATGELLPVVQSIRISENWTGGDAGLLHVSRLTGLGQLYLIDGHPISDDGIATLQQRMPDLRIEPRSAVCLGISASSFVRPERGVMVDNVAPGKSAANGGIRRNDTILRIGDAEIENFGNLVDVLKGFKPGQKVDVVVLRETSLGITNEVKLEIKFTGW